MDNLLPLMLFAFVSSITPGPNNLMLLSSGVNFGVRRTWPHALGVVGGCFVMWCATGLGVAAVFLAWPAAELLLRVVGGGYLLYLAWRLAGAGAVKTRQPSAPQPLGPLGAAMFQWVNPKAWMMALTTFSAYALGQAPLDVLMTSVVACLVMLPSVSVWVLGGHSLGGWLATPSRARAFNVIMAALLLLTMVPVFLF